MIRYEGLKEIKNKFDEILDTLANSKKDYSINILENTLNDEYENVSIKINRIEEGN